MFKITIYSVRKVERPLFEKLNKYDFDLNLVSERLTIDNVDKAEGSDAVLISGFDDCDGEIIKKLHEFGINYVYTRVVGVDNIDFTAIDGYGMQVANAPGYSPRAVAELAFILGMTLFRHVSPATYNTHMANFALLPSYFANEIHNATIGIVGAGTLGTAEAKLYGALGAKVLAYQRHPDPENKAVEFTDMDTLLKESDIVSMHIPYIPGKTGNFIGKEEIDKMKDGAILVNTARGPVVDNQAVSYAVRNFKLGGYGTDVLLDEDKIMGKQFDSLDDLPNDIDKDLMLNYPNVIVTPHMGFYTEKAVEDMINISFENFDSMLKTGKPTHLVNK
ncbi:lactate dehydrogenase [Fructilactobacillus lindneri]|uniref:Lactate dehydrogenase n=1 Tax=Fructilactobacillus lindneri TaxID=53444 RepID=A0AB33BCL7_9LACO|nr:NAD(P)-dependent oxidoreductase [Fructilactobacillus lindneri]ANZ59026.1 lactate dehydrogenase [Fructilactobacillus lindneri]POG98080.1 lactate dehydrogenase [Fructilactobacillus lindneri]POH01805.1 lactate dehydrogenase [Fructilactobacillus lindneri]POH03650.1 lactate dehydrogenase [Fructilactobacillus lindneri]POH06393.1 lactate dehydrogenase [Fructilactobacillus lindneri]